MYIKRILTDRQMQPLIIAALFLAPAALLFIGPALPQNADANKSERPPENLPGTRFHPARPPYQPTSEEKQQIQAKLDELDRKIAELRWRGTDSDLLADVEIYSEAARWKVTYPEEFFKLKSVADTLQVLDRVWRERPRSGKGSRPRPPVDIDGQTQRVKPAPEMAFEMVNGAWRPAALQAKGRRKKHGLQGPIDDAFLEPFLAVRPTCTPWNSATNDQALRILQRFERQYSLVYRGHIRIEEDVGWRLSNSRYGDFGVFKVNEGSDDPAARYAGLFSETWQVSNPKNNQTQHCISRLLMLYFFNAFLAHEKAF
jgi:hypothetical protein